MLNQKKSIDKEINIYLQGRQVHHEGNDVT